MDQRELVERAARGDHDAFATLVGASIARLEAVSRLILRDQELARDAVQDAYIRAWRDLPGLRDPDRFDAWLHRLTVNSSLDAMRRRRRRPIEVELSRSSRRPSPTGAATSSTGTSSSVPSATSVPTCALCSSCTTTSVCPPPRWPRRSISRRAPPSRGCTGPWPSSVPPSRPMSDSRSTLGQRPHEPAGRPRATAHRVVRGDRLAAPPRLHRRDRPVRRRHPAAAALELPRPMAPTWRGGNRPLRDARPLRWRSRRSCSRPSPPVGRGPRRGPVGSHRSRLPPPFGLAANGLVAYADRGDIVAVDPISGVRMPITSGPATDVEPRWSLDGTPARVPAGLRGRAAARDSSIPAGRTTWSPRMPWWTSTPTDRVGTGRSVDHVRGPPRGCGWTPGHGHDVRRRVQRGRRFRRRSPFGALRTGVS